MISAALSFKKQNSNYKKQKQNKKTENYLKMYGWHLIMLRKLNRSLLHMCIDARHAPGGLLTVSTGNEEDKHSPCPQGADSLVRETDNETSR